MCSGRVTASEAIDDNGSKRVQGISRIVSSIGNVALSKACIGVSTERSRDKQTQGRYQSIISSAIPLTGVYTPPGLLEPGQLVEIQDITDNWQGLYLYSRVKAESG